MILLLCVGISIICCTSNASLCRSNVQRYSLKLENFTQAVIATCPMKKTNSTTLPPNATITGDFSKL
uniref:Secreted protein n=1 Tax=Mesocestoides corti TaxID=53468 RepID=A0A5K3FJG8_MESCO